MKQKKSEYKINLFFNEDGKSVNEAIKAAFIQYMNYINHIGTGNIGIACDEHESGINE